MITEQQTILGLTASLPRLSQFIFRFALGFQAGWQAALQSLFLQQQFSNGYFEKATSWSYKTEEDKRNGFEISAPTQPVWKVIRTREHRGAATFPPVVDCLYGDNTLSWIEGTGVTDLGLVTSQLNLHNQAVFF